MERKYEKIDNDDERRGRQKGSTKIFMNGRSKNIECGKQSYKGRERKCVKVEGERRKYEK